jgi:hypothetical protein
LKIKFQKDMLKVGSAVCYATRVENM